MFKVLNFIKGVFNRIVKFFSGEKKVTAATETLVSSVTAMENTPVFKPVRIRPTTGSRYIPNFHLVGDVKVTTPKTGIVRVALPDLRSLEEIETAIASLDRPSLTRAYLYGKKGDIELQEMQAQWDNEAQEVADLCTRSSSLIEAILANDAKTESLIEGADELIATQAELEVRIAATRHALLGVNSNVDLSTITDEEIMDEYIYRHEVSELNSRAVEAAMTESVTAVMH